MKEIKRSLIKRRVFQIFISLIVIIVLVKSIDFSKTEISQIHYLYAFYLFLSMIAAYILRANIYRILILKERSIKIGILFKITSIYNFISSLFPFGVGHLSYPFLIKKYCRVSLKSSVNSLFTYNLIRIILLSLILTVSALMVINIKTIKLSIMNNNFLLYTFLVVIILCLCFLFLKKLRRASGNEKMNNLFDGMNKIISCFKLDLILVPRVTVLAILIIICNIFNVYFSYRAFGFELPVLSIMFLLSMNNLSTFLPIHAACSIGSFELVNTFALVLMGFDINKSIQISFAVHFLALILQGVVALICYLILTFFYDRNNSEQAI